MPKFHPISHAKQTQNLVSNETLERIYNDHIRKRDALDKQNELVQTLANDIYSFVQKIKQRNPNIHQELEDLFRNIREYRKVFNNEYINMLHKTLYNYKYNNKLLHTPDIKFMEFCCNLLMEESSDLSKNHKFEQNFVNELKEIMEFR